MKKYLHLFLFLFALGLAACEDSKEVRTIDFTLQSSDSKNPTQMRLKSESFATEFAITSNARWAISKPEKASWLTVSPIYGKGDGPVSLTAEANETSDFRQADITFYANNQQALVLTIKQEPNGTFLVVDPQKVEVPAEGGDAVLTIDSNAEQWEYTIPVDATAWLKEAAKTPTGITFTVSANPKKKARTATVEFAAIAGEERIVKEIVIAQDAGKSNNAVLLLDVVFNSDGTASDLSQGNLPIETVAGTALNVYRNESYGCQVARFSHDPGTVISSGYYKVDYSDNQAFKDALADGHSMEALVMYDSEPVGKEVKPFSSMEAGGTGFLLKKETGEFTFLPNLGGWKWTTSGVVPQRGVYYHLVGVWDKQAQKSRIYVNGELKLEIDVQGDFKLAKDGSTWFCIGGDAGPSGGQAAWKGDIVLARIYDDALSAQKVTSLWEAVKDKQPTETVQITDPLVLSGLNVNTGYKYRILGQGYKAGDQVRFLSKSGEKVYTMTGQIAEKYIEVQIPADFVTGEYDLTLVRKSATCPLGTVTLTVSDTPTVLKMPAIIAHRGYHADAGAAPNSIASFTAAQAEGYYGSESDFYITKDGVVVCNHDAAIGGKTIENSDYADIKDEKLSNGEVLPTLADYLDKLKSSGSKTKLILEIKSHSTAANNTRAVDAIVKQVSDASLAIKTDYIAFSYDVCTQLVAKSLPTGTVIGYLSGDKAPDALDAGINCIDYNMTPLRDNPAWIQQAHESDRTVNAWTVNSQQDMVDFIVMGVDYITTDNPQILKELFTALSE